LRALGTNKLWRQLDHFNNEWRVFFLNALKLSKE
jgi:hypothetical protein